MQSQRTGVERTLQYFEDKGRVGASFYANYGFGLHAVGEAQILRIKQDIDASLLTQTLESQTRENVVIANIIAQQEFDRQTGFR